MKAFKNKYIFQIFLQHPKFDLAAPWLGTSGSTGTLLFIINGSNPTEFRKQLKTKTTNTNKEQEIK
jgi:hypothetical protein